MKLIIATLFVAASLTNVATCSAKKISPQRGKETTRTVKVTDFNKIDASTGIKVVYSQGPLKLAKITAPENIHKYVTVQTEYGELGVSIDQAYFDDYNSFNNNVTVTVSSPNVYSYDVSSGAQIEVIGNLKLHHEIEIDASSGGKVAMPDGVSTTSSANIDVSSGARIDISGIKAKDIECEASSGSQLNIIGIKSDTFSLEASSGAKCAAEGIASRIDLEASSAASIKASELKAEKAIVSASSSSKIHYNADKAREKSDESSTVVNSAI